MTVRGAGYLTGNYDGGFGFGFPRLPLTGGLYLFRITDYKFLCGSGTAFEQKSRTCQEIEKIDCSSSAKNYHVNNHLIVTSKLKGNSISFPDCADIYATKYFVQ